MKKEKELQLHKLMSFTKNISQLIMINPNLLANPQILFQIQQAKEKIIDLREELRRKNMALLHGEEYDSSLNESMFSNEEEF